MKEPWLCSVTIMRSFSFQSRFYSFGPYIKNNMTYCSDISWTYFQNKFFSTFSTVTSFALKLFYSLGLYKYVASHDKSVVTELTALCTSHCVIPKIRFSCTSLTRNDTEKMFQLELTEFNEIYFHIT
jgi:hypothetical protein